MKRLLSLSCALLGLLVPATADVVVLKSGAELRGRIVGENAHELILETERTLDGSIRTRKVILHSAVDRVQRGSPEVAIVEPGEAPRATPSIDEPPPAPEEAGLAAGDERLMNRLKEALQTSGGLLSQGQYDQAIQTFGLVAQHQRLLALQEAGGEGTLRALQLREEAYRLWEAAVEGKVEYQEELVDQREEEVERTVRAAEDALKDYEKLVEQREEERRVVRMKRDADPLPVNQQELARFEQQLQRARAYETRFLQWKKETELDNQHLEAELKILKEAHKQTRDELSDLSRASRRR